MTFPVFIKANRSKISISKEIREVNRLRLQYERSMRARMFKLFKRVGKACASEYEINETINKSLIDLDKKIGQELRVHYGEVIERFGNRVYENRKMERFGQLLFQLYSREGAQKVVGITNATRKSILKAIEIGEADGLGVAKTAKLIRQRTSGSIARSRATTIARTETHAAASYATHEATKELGLPRQKKRWVSVSDARTRSGHASVNGQEVGIDDMFVVPYKGNRIEMKYPHDGGGGAGNNINCRCLAIYFTDEDSLFDDGVAKPLPKPIAFVPVEKPKLELENIMVMKRNSKFKPSDITNALNDNMTVLTLSVAEKLVKPTRITEGRGVYYANEKHLSTDLNDLTAVHEYGHHVDHIIGINEGTKWWSDDGLKSSILADGKKMGIAKGQRNKEKMFDKQFDELFKKVETTKKFSNGTTTTYMKTVPKFLGATMLSDIIDSYAKGKFRKDYNAWGHTQSYWKKRPTGQQHEIFANIYAVQSHTKAIKWLKKYMPETYAIFIQKMKEISEDV